jgi:hypothetical protein
MRPRTFRTQLTVEALEDRTVPTTFSPISKAGILVGMLRPAHAEVATLVRAPGGTFVGPQPEPPTKPLANAAVNSGHAAILVGMLSPKPAQTTSQGRAEIDPQPEPPRAVPVVPNAAAYFSQLSLVNAAWNR